MKKVKITVKKIIEHKDLIEQYENTINNPCCMHLGDEFICEEYKKPNNFCDSAWESISPFVLTLLCGGENIYGGWMKNSRSAMISCNDGFRPVSFYLEAIE